MLSDRIKDIFGHKNRVGAVNDGVIAAKTFELTRRRGGRHAHAICLRESYVKRRRRYLNIFEVPFDWIMASYLKSIYSESIKKR